MAPTRIAALAAVGLAGLWLTFYPTLHSGFARMQPDAGDVLLNNLFLEHTYRWAFDPNYPFSFWSPGYFYPTPNTFTYSETLIGTAPLYWLLRAGLTETVAGQVWVILTCAFNFVAMAVVLRWFGVNTLLTAAGAFVFAFGLIRTDHLTHQQLLPQYFSPFAVWYAWACLRDPTARRWVTLIGLVTAQILASLHLGWFLGLGLLIMVAWGLIVEPGSRGRVWRFVRGQPVATVLPLVAAATTLAPYAQHFYRGTPDTRAYWEAAMFCPYPDGWFVAAPHSLWADHLTPRDPDVFAEQMLFQGFTVYGVLLAAGWYAWRRRFPARGLVLAGVGTAVVLALLVTRWGYNVSLWYLINQAVPGANAFRAVGRIMFVGYLIGLVGGLVGVQALVRNLLTRPSARRAVFVLVAGGLIVEQVRPLPESFDKQAEFLNRVESLVPRLQGVDTVWVINDGSMPHYRHEITVMWAGLWTQTPVMNGFSGTMPPGYAILLEQPTVAECAARLGSDWHGRLAVIEWGPPIRRTVYEVEPGGRYRLVEGEGPASIAGREGP